MGHCLRQSVYIGFEPRETDAFAVCRSSLKKHAGRLPPLTVHGLVLDDLRRAGLYYRPTERRPGVDRPVLYDVISEHAMATEFAISRFLIGHLAGEGYAMFMDCDMLVRSNVRKLFDFCQKDRKKAVWCVKHNHAPSGATKMDGQVQSAYSRKNWSSVMVWNTDHAANKRLTVEMINSLPGRDLHRFCWLQDDEIGELGPEWNYLIGESAHMDDPKIAHFTLGVPTMRGYENSQFADEWRAELNSWAVAA